MVKKEFVLWGTKGGVEDVIRVNGREVQDSLVNAKKIKAILEKRGGFESVRIQTVNLGDWNIKETFTKGMR